MRNKKLIEISMHISEFEMPPMQDVLIVGKLSPIGPEASRRMVDALAPGQFEVLAIEHPAIEAVVIRKALFNLLPRETLVEVILEEAGRISGETMITRAQVTISLRINRTVELP